MNILLWVLQGLTALLYAASGYMKVFMFDQVSTQSPSFAAYPKSVWQAFGVVELICVVLLIVPSALRWHPKLTVFAAAILAIETIFFVWGHIRFHENGPMIMSTVLGLIMAFIAYGRAVLSPIAPRV
jgi:uncharacterized membrane protein YphA (DoxX/SURF4 family)